MNNNYDVVKCTRCGKPFTNFRIVVEMAVSTDRVTEMNTFETIPNLTQISKEILCEDCFNYFVSTLEKMNEPFSEQDAKNMKEREENPLGVIGIVNSNQLNENCNCGEDNCNNIEENSAQQDKKLGVNDFVKTIDDCEYK